MRILKPIILILIVFSIISMLVFQQGESQYKYLSFQYLIETFQENLKFDAQALIDSFGDIVDTVSEIGTLFSKAFPASELGWWNIVFPITQTMNLLDFLFESLPSLFRLAVSFLRLLFFLLQDGVGIIGSVLDTLDAVFHPTTVVPDIFAP